MRVLGASVLALEAIVVILAIPAVVVLGTVPVPPAVAIPIGVILAIALVVVARYVTKPWAITAGWTLQVLVILTGFLTAWMFVVGGIFALLWLMAIRLGREADGRAG